jgi:hypothetical protein
MPARIDDFHDARSGASLPSKSPGMRAITSRPFEPAVEGKTARGAWTRDSGRRGSRQYDWARLHRHPQLIWSGPACDPSKSQRQRLPPEPLRAALSTLDLARQPDTGSSSPMRSIRPVSGPWRTVFAGHHRVRRTQKLRDSTYVIRNSRSQRQDRPAKVARRSRGNRPPSFSDIASREPGFCRSPPGTATSNERGPPTIRRRLPTIQKPETVICYVRGTGL